MIRPYLVPFKAEHEMVFKSRESWTEYEWTQAFEKEKYPAYTGMVGEEIIGCAGVLIPRPGFGIAWVMLSPVAVLKYRVWLSKTCRRVLEDVIRSFHLYRVEAIVFEDNEVNKQWVKFMGFTQENGRAANYLPNKQSILRYERIS
jgi:hypothetical protein